MTAMPNEFSPILGERGANPFLESLYEFRIWTAPKIKGIEGDEISSPLAVNDKHRQNRQYLTGPKFGLWVRFEITPVISGVLHQRVFAFQIAKPLKRIGAIPHGSSVFTLDPRKVKIVDLANQARNRGGPQI